MSRRLSPAAIALGLGGLVPLVVCGYAAVALHGPRVLMSALPPGRALFALVAYAGTILSFLGAVHWGFALSGASPAPAVNGRRVETMQLASGVLPALVAWVSLLLAGPAASPLGAIVLLAVGFALVLAAEQRGARSGAVPRAYLGLRWVLTAVVLIVLLGVLVMREASLRFGG